MAPGRSLLPGLDQGLPKGQHHSEKTGVPQKQTVWQSSWGTPESTGSPHYGIRAFSAPANCLGGGCARLAG